MKYFGNVGNSLNTTSIYDMMVHFWGTGYLGHKIREGVIKLIPKLPVKLHANDWRALTMLTTVYKILAKLLSNHLKPLMPRIISPQQTGFIHGRNILDNISIAWLTRDWLC